MKHAAYFKDFLKDHVNLNQTRIDTLESRVEAVFKALKSDVIIGALITGKLPQGSWPHKLIIKPKPDGDFDADFLLEMKRVEGWEPKRYIDEVYNALHRNTTYTKQDHGRKCRCTYLEYAPENGIGCHLDIVPFITLESGSRVIVNRDENIWEPEMGSTNPAAFSEWIKRRDELAGKQFRPLVRIMKYIKAERGSFNGVKSVILTTLLGNQITELSALSPTRFVDLPTALVNTVEELDKWLQARPYKPSIPNPSGDGTNFDHRWTEVTYQNFRSRINVIAADMRKAFDEPDEAKSMKAWQAILGEKFSPPSSTAASSLTNPFASASATVAARASRSGRAG
jgi:hypothetical protein